MGQEADESVAFQMNKVVLWPKRAVDARRNDNVLPKVLGHMRMPMDRTGGETDDLSLSLCLI